MTFQSIPKCNPSATHAKALAPVVFARDLRVYRAQRFAFDQAVETRAGRVDENILRGQVVVGAEP